ncbi:MAG: MinD/ParA family protein [Lachnospiraceae bacterium]|nr:MinD/ParA family protein [Lachnospiraceae bacterium]
MDQATVLRQMVSATEEKPSARVITVTSGKGGVGKSSISLNLAICISRMGKRVVLLDADFGLANIEVMLGVRPKANLADLMFRGKDLKDIIMDGPEGIKFISGGSGIQELARMNREQCIYLTKKLVELDELADVIIIDTGAGISDSVLEFVASSNEVLLIATPEPTSITDAYALLKALNRKSEFSKSSTTIKMIANRVRNEDEGRNVLYENMKNVVDRFLNISLEFLGSIPQDDQVSKAVMKQTPVTMCAPNSGASRAIEDMAKELLSDGEESETAPEERGITLLFSNLIRNKFKKKQ